MADGPLQYEATAVLFESKKASDSCSGNRVTMYVFSDLKKKINTNMMVQFARCYINGICVTSMRKPVNDLSREKLVEDILLPMGLWLFKQDKANE